MNGATCLVTRYFMSADERRRAFAEVDPRMKPGAPFIVAHHGLPQYEPARTLWLSRFAAFGANPREDLAR